MISAYIPGISWYISDIKILIFWPVPGPWLSAIPSSVEALIASGLLATQGAPAQALQKCLGWIPNAHMNDHGISWLLTLDHDWNRSCAGPVCFADENTSGPFEAKYASLPILRDACDGPRFETDKDELVQVGKLRYISIFLLKIKLQEMTCGLANSSVAVEQQAPANEKSGVPGYLHLSCTSAANRWHRWHPTPCTHRFQHGLAESRGQLWGFRSPLALNAWPMSLILLALSSATRRPVSHSVTCASGHWQY